MSGDLSEVFSDSSTPSTSPADYNAAEAKSQEVSKPEPASGSGGDYDYTELSQLESRMEADKQEKFEASLPKGDVKDSAAKQDEGTDSNSNEPDTATPDIDVELLAQAEAWGISREAAHKLGEADLAKEINRLWMRHAVSQHQATAKQEPSESDDLKALIDEMKADADGYDPKLLKVMESTYSRLRKAEERDQERFIAEQRRQEQFMAVAHQQETESWDKLLNEIDMPDVLGKGTYGKEIKDGSREFKSRAQIVRAAVNLRAVFPEESDRDLLLRAARATFGDRFETKAQQELAKEVSKRATQILPRPRTTKAQTPLSDWERFKDRYDKVIGGGAKTQTVDEIFA